MANIIESTVNRLFGSKSKKDVKLIEPFVGLINAEFDKMANWSNDELRANTDKFRKQVKAHLADINKKIDDLNAKANSDPDMDLLEKEAIYEEVDKLKKTKDDQLEELLMQILPEAFATVKETARRFNDNESLEVTATELDKEFAASKDYIEINGDKATYQNSWTAAGVPVTWNMVHYDVQLIGGVVLHKGKIAEMATGEGKTLVATLPSYLNGLAGLGFS